MCLVVSKYGDFSQPMVQGLYNLLGLYTFVWWLSIMRAAWIGIYSSPHPPLPEPPCLPSLILWRLWNILCPHPFSNSLVSTNAVDPAYDTLPLKFLVLSICLIPLPLSCDTFYLLLILTLLIPPMVMSRSGDKKNPTPPSGRSLPVWSSPSSEKITLRRSATGKPSSWSQRETGISVG